MKLYVMKIMDIQIWNKLVSHEKYNFFFLFTTKIVKILKSNNRVNTIIFNNLFSATFYLY